MSFLFKVVLFGIIIFYIFRKIFGLIDRITGRKPAPHDPRVRREGDVKIEYQPDNKKGGRFGSEFKGGDYVDYEEIKNQ